MLKARELAGLIRETAQVSDSTERLMGPGEEQMDQEARDLGTKAISQISTHEILCTERWEQSRAALARVEAQLTKLSDAMNNRVAWIPASIIMLLMGAVGWLVHR